MLPTAVGDALDDLADGAPQAGALLLRGLPIGDLAADAVDTASRRARRPSQRVDAAHRGLPARRTRRLRARARRRPRPEHRAHQARPPTRQTSTSSRVELMFHTEAAFHPHRPRYLLLLCLRGDPAAAHDAWRRSTRCCPLLPAPTSDVLFEPRFRTAVDESYLHGRAQRARRAGAGAAAAERDRPTMVFDADLMVGTDAQADDALAVARPMRSPPITRRRAANPATCWSSTTPRRCTAAVRSPPASTAPTGGCSARSSSPTSRASAGERRGRVITTRFGA